VDYLSYLRGLEEVILRTLTHFGVKGERISGRTGVWVRPIAAPGFSPSPPAKIASIGVKVTAQGVSQHGFALNVDPDMSYWEGIVACGLHDAPSTSLSALLGEPPDLRAVRDIYVREFGRVFRYSPSYEALNTSNT
jgi:lipoate-protein ligase B